MTAASDQFDAFLAAANSGRAPLKAFFKERCPSLPENHNLDLELSSMMTGGFDLRRTEENSGTRLAALIQDRAQGHFRRVIIEVQSQAPQVVTRFVEEPATPPPDLATPRMSEPDGLAAFSDHLDHAAAVGAFSGAVLVAKRGAPIFSGAYGLQDREREIPNRVDTRFRIASVGKAFTAVAVVQLVQQGTIGLFEPIGTYLPDYPHKKVAARVTPHHLLTHTSGIYDDALGFQARRDELTTLEDFMTVFGPSGLVFEPGTRWSYANYNFILLGLILQRAAKQDYYDYVRDHVFERAGMTSSGFEADPSGQRDAVGYMTRPEWAEFQQVTTPSAIHRALPAGGCFSTVEDLHRFADALIGHRLLDATHTELLTTGKVDAGALGTAGGREAYGLEDFVVDGVQWLSRTGSGTGSNANLRIYPQTGYVVVVLANISPPAALHMSAFISDRLPAR